jgi:hypothetical protein
MDATTYLQDQLMNWMVNGTNFDTAPTNIYVALHNGEPGDNAQNNELDSAGGEGGYVRYETTIPGDWNQPATGEFENANDFIFAEATEDWGQVSHFSLWDSQTGGNPLAEDSLVSSVTVNTGDAPVFRDGNLSGTFE